MRYFLDTEYNGWGGALLSLALVPEDGEELYLTLGWNGVLEEWVERNVVPYLDMVPDNLKSPRMSRADAARMLAHYLAGDRDPLIIADWPEDIALLNALLVTAPGAMAEVPVLTFQFVPLSGFSTAANSKVPHNALHDARCAISILASEYYSAAVRRGHCSRSIQVGRPASALARPRNDADLAHRLAVAPVGARPSWCHSPFRPTGVSPARPGVTLALRGKRIDDPAAIVWSARRSRILPATNLLKRSDRMLRAISSPA
jgi:hypothetical protein